MVFTGSTLGTSSAFSSSDKPFLNDLMPLAKSPIRSENLPRPPNKSRPMMSARGAGSMAGGRMKCAMKQDGASLLRFEVSYGKAYAALAMGRESRQVLQKAKDKPLFMQSFLELADGPMFLEGGGQLIRDKDGEVVGGGESSLPGGGVREVAQRVDAEEEEGLELA